MGTAIFILVIIAFTAIFFYLTGKKEKKELGL